VPTGNDVVWHYLEETLRNLGRLEEVLTAYDRALAFDRDNAFVWEEKAHALHELRRYEEALEACNHALAINPDARRAAQHKGFILEKSGRYEEALEVYDQVLAIAPDMLIVFCRGRTLKALGRHEEALAAFLEALTGIQKAISRSQIATNSQLPYFVWDDKEDKLSLSRRIEEALASHFFEE
jgi:superkiller protein 3